MGRVQGFAGGYAGDPLPCIDLRADGGLVVYPGSRHPNGGLYTWLDGLSPDKWGIAEPPDWLLDYIRAHNEERGAPRPEPALTPQGRADLVNMDARSKRYAEAALQGEVSRVAAAPLHTRNTTLNKAAYALSPYISAGLLTEGEVWQALEGAAYACGLTGADGAAATRSTIRSGLRAGAAKPANLPLAQQPLRGRGGTGGGWDGGGGGGGALMRLRQAAQAARGGQA